MDTQTASPALAGYRSTATTVLRVLAMLGGTLVVIQFGLAGFGAFRALDKVDEPFTAHETLGMVIGVVSLLVFIAALVGRPSRRTVWLALALLVTAVLQPGLAALGDDAAFWGLLHAMVGLGIFALYYLLSRRVPEA